MENIRKFYNELREFIKSDAPRAIKRFGIIEEFEEYPLLVYLDENKMLEFRDNIANKALILGEEARKVYAGLIITELDSYYYSLLKDCETREGKISLPCNCEATIEDEPIDLGPKVDYIKTYQLIGIDGQYFDFSGIISDWRFFMYEIWRVFFEFGIDLLMIVDSKKDLDCDYNFIRAFNSGEKIRNVNDLLKERNGDHKRNCVSTSRRRILAITQIMNEIYPGFVNIEKTGRARFIQFLTGDESNTHKISDTNIYQYLKKIERIQYGKDNAETVLNGYNNDIEVVAKNLDELGIDKIAEKIRGLKMEIKI